jgi:hypothetical protein
MKTKIPVPSKPFFLSKSLIVAFVGMVAMLLQGQYGWVIDADIQAAAVLGILALLRVFTQEGVRLSPKISPEELEIVEALQHIRMKQKLQKAKTEPEKPAP